MGWKMAQDDKKMRSRQSNERTRDAASQGGKEKAQE